jgi:hypothetical protein
LPNIFYEFHQIANISCIKMETNLKWPFQLTLTRFLEFLNNYKLLLSQKTGSKL